MHNMQKYVCHILRSWALATSFRRTLSTFAWMTFADQEAGDKEQYPSYCYRSVTSVHLQYCRANNLQARVLFRQKAVFVLAIKPNIDWHVLMGVNHMQKHTWGKDLIKITHITRTWSDLHTCRVIKQLDILKQYLRLILARISPTACKETLNKRIYWETYWTKDNIEKDDRWLKRREKTLLRLVLWPYSKEMSNFFLAMLPQRGRCLCKQRNNFTLQVVNKLHSPSHFHLLLPVISTSQGTYSS